MDIYQQNILDCYKHPKQYGPLQNASHKSGVANPSCGDSVQIGLVVENGRVAQAKWEGEGCVLSQASADMLMEALLGMELSEVKKIDTAAVVSLLGIELSPNRLRCALLPLEALQQAVS